MTTSKQADTEPGAMERFANEKCGITRNYRNEQVEVVELRHLVPKAREIDATIADLRAREHALADALREIQATQMSEWGAREMVKIASAALAGQPTTTEER